MDANQPLDYSKLNAIELQALIIAHQNLGRPKDEPFSPAYPYFCAALEEVAATFGDLTAEHLTALKIFHDEIKTINKHLLDLPPSPPSLIPEEMVGKLTNDELIDGLLKHGVVLSLVSAFNHIQESAAMQIAMIENGAAGETNGRIN